MSVSAAIEGRGWKQATAVCDALTEDEDVLTREMVTRLADKWSLWTMAVARRVRPRAPLHSRDGAR